MKKLNPCLAKVAQIDPSKLEKLDIIYGTALIGGAEHVIMTERDWKWAVRAGAAILPCKSKTPNSPSYSGTP